MQLKILDAESINFDEFHELLKFAFFERDSTNTSIRVPSPAELEFKYKNAIGNSKIAIFRDSNKLVAVNGLLPIPLNSPEINGSGEIAWMSVDTATHPDYRGLGLFKKCVIALEDSAPRDSLIFGFPNTNSMPGFMKMNWKVYREYRLWVRPRSIVADKNVLISEIAFKDLPIIDNSKLGIAKSYNYFKWRYPLEKNIYKAFCIELQNEMYFVVSRIMTLNGIKLTVVLELIKNNLSKKKLTAKGLAELSKRLDTAGALIALNDVERSATFVDKLIQVPHQLVSRRVFLAGKFLGKSPKIIHNPSNWHINLGDFDAI